MELPPTTDQPPPYTFTNAAADLSPQEKEYPQSLNNGKGSDVSNGFTKVDVQNGGDRLTTRL